MADLLGSKFSVRREAQERSIPGLYEMQEQALPRKTVLFVSGRCCGVAMWAHVVWIPLHKL